MLPQSLTYAPLVLPLLNIRDALPDDIFQVSDSVRQLPILSDLCLDSLRYVSFQVLNLLSPLIHLIDAVPPLFLYLLL